MLSRFRTLVNLASTKRPAEDDGSMATREVAASEALKMEVESLALVCPLEFDSVCGAYIGIWLLRVWLTSLQ
jgi:hypothetical protein